MTIGSKIKELRREKAMSQKNLAEKLGVTSQAISKWETDSSLPEMTMLPDIASIFGIQIDDLFEYATKKRYESICKKIEYGRVLTNHEFDSEEAFLLKEAESNPDNYEAISLLGDLYRHQANCMNKKSIHFAKQALRLSPNSKNDLNNICNASGGRVFDWDVYNHHELIDYLTKTLKEEPANTRIYFYLLDNLIDDGRYEEAKAVLKSSRMHNPDSLNDYYALFIEEKQYGFNQVKEAYGRLAASHAKDWRVLFSIANSFSFNECYEEAIRYWQMTFDCMEKPRYTDALESMAQCSIRMRDKKQAVNYYKQELKLLAEDWDIHYGSDVDALQEKIRRLS